MEQQTEQLGGLLKRCRARVDAERCSLGPYLRLPIRIGKSPTQEEVAEAAGISRQWYALLESDRPPLRVSARVLARIANALMMDAEERAALFRLALPELREARLADCSTAVFDAFEPVRRIARHLWTASTEAEALTIVREYALTRLCPDLMITRTRVGEGYWEYDGTGRDSTDGGARVQQLDALLRQHRGTTAVDDSLCHPLLAQPGELLTRSERPVQSEEDSVELESVGWTNISFAIANIRSHDGFIARLLAFYHTDHAFSEVERAELSALADLASLAISGRI
jgi:transcriptional regulator with XRE-family HTH domain